MSTLPGGSDNPTPDNLFDMIGNKLYYTGWLTIIANQLIRGGYPWKLMAS